MLNNFENAKIDHRKSCVVSRHTSHTQPNKESYCDFMISADVIDNRIWTKSRRKTFTQILREQNLCLALLTQLHASCCFVCATHSIVIVTESQQSPVDWEFVMHAKNSQRNHDKRAAPARRKCCCSTDNGNRHPSTNRPTIKRFQLWMFESYFHWYRRCCTLSPWTVAWQPAFFSLDRRELQYLHGNCQQQREEMNMKRIERRESGSTAASASAVSCSVKVAKQLSP